MTMYYEAKSYFLTVQVDVPLSIVQCRMSQMYHFNETIGRYGCAGTRGAKENGEARASAPPACARGLRGDALLLYERSSSSPPSAAAAAPPPPRLCAA